MSQEREPISSVVLGDPTEMTTIVQPLLEDNLIFSLPKFTENEAETPLFESMPVTIHAQPNTISVYEEDFSLSLKYIAISAQTGNLDAIEKFLDMIQPGILGYVGNRSYYLEDVEDITQEVLLRVASNLNAFEFRGNLPIMSWVFKIARNEIIMHVRKRAVRSSEYPVTALWDKSFHEEDFPDPYLNTQVQKEVSSLPKAQHDVIISRFMEGLTVSETARKLGKTENNVKVLQYKALKRMRTSIHKFA